jgi:hypothetical protein
MDAGSRRWGCGCRTSTLPARIGQTGQSFDQSNCFDVDVDGDQFWQRLVLATSTTRSTAVVVDVVLHSSQAAGKHTHTAVGSCCSGQASPQVDQSADQSSGLASLTSGTGVTPPHLTAARSHGLGLVVRPARFQRAQARRGRGVHEEALVVEHPAEPEALVLRGRGRFSEIRAAMERG